jgi:hypothetical protein
MLFNQVVKIESTVQDVPEGRHPRSHHCLILPSISNESNFRWLFAASPNFVCELIPRNLSLHAQSAMKWIGCGISNMTRKWRRIGRNLGLSSVIRWCIADAVGDIVVDEGLNHSFDDS